MTVSFATLGCKLNQSETEALAQAFLQAGFRIAVTPGVSTRTNDAFHAGPDIVIINSCTVTSKSDQKARKLVRLYEKKHPRALVILTGCYAEVEFKTLRRLFEDLFYIGIVPQSKKNLLAGFAEIAIRIDGFALYSRRRKWEVLNDYLGREGGTVSEPFGLVAGIAVFHARAFLKIEDGCDNACAYCRVPPARGGAVSLDFATVVERIKAIVDRGFYEIVLTGVNISCYRSGERDLAALLEYALAHTRNVRFRLSSLEPEAFTPRLFEVLSDPAVCPHFHLPIQSGSDRVLAGMGRRYRTATVEEYVSRLKAARPDAFVSADLIAGFPGETDADFEATRRLAVSLGLSRLHVFPFSRRPGTEAFFMPDIVPDSLIRQRVSELIGLSEAALQSFLRGLDGKVVDVILEKEAGKDAYSGSCGNSIKCLVTEIPLSLMKKRLRVNAGIVKPAELSRAIFLNAWEGEPRFIAAGKIMLENPLTL